MSVCDENAAMVKLDGKLPPPKRNLDLGGSPGSNAAMLPPYTFKPCEPGEVDLLTRLMRQRPNDTGELPPLPKRSMYQRGSLDTPPGPCLICSLDEHSFTVCPYYKSFVPKNAIVGCGCGCGCGIICKVCGGLFSGSCCNQDSGRASPKVCTRCFKYGDHLSHECPLMSVNTSIGFRPLSLPGFSSRYAEEISLVCLASSRSE